MPANNTNSDTDRNNRTDTDNSRPIYVMECETCGNYGETDNPNLAGFLVGMHNRRTHDGEPTAEKRTIDAVDAEGYDR